MNTEAQAPYGCKAKIIRDRAGNSVPPHRLFLPRLRTAESATPGSIRPSPWLPLFLLNRIQKSVDRLVAPGVFIRQARRSGLIQLHLLLRLLLLTEVLVDLSQVVVRLGQVRIHARASL